MLKRLLRLFRTADRAPAEPAPPRDAPPAKPAAPGDALPTRSYLPDEDEAGFFQSVVGESFYQPILRDLAGRGPVHRVYLQPESDNPHDPTAVAVTTMEGATVGYLPRDEASRLWRQLRDQELSSGQMTSCLARLMGGEEDKPRFGVVLNLARPGETRGARSRAQDDAAWERHEDRKTAGGYSWTYGDTTVHYGQASWEYHEPDTYRPKALGDRFYNELSPDHVAELLDNSQTATQEGRVRERLERAAEVAYMRRKHSDAARALADVLTRQCVETYGARCSGAVFEWRAKLLVERGLTADAVRLLTERLEGCRDERERERLAKALRWAERKGRGKPARE